MSYLSSCLISLHTGCMCAVSFSLPRLEMHSSGPLCVPLVDATLIVCSAFMMSPDLKDYQWYIFVVISFVGCTLWPFRHSAIAASPKIAQNWSGDWVTIHWHMFLWILFSGYDCSLVWTTKKEITPLFIYSLVWGQFFCQGEEREVLHVLTEMNCSWFTTPNLTATHTHILSSHCRRFKFSSLQFHSSIEKVLMELGVPREKMGTF